uniref:Flotillin-1 n=1 Tax=Caligus rogercresseyi TaxID=217165 RepID=C1BQB0_CALRO|nr:Flotillin-1 [Caligus rogercresseyi]
MYCIQYLDPEPGEALVWASPLGTSVLRYGRDAPRWSLFPEIFRVPTSSLKDELCSTRGLTEDAIEVSLVGGLRWSFSCDTDSMVMDMAERFWSRGLEGVREMIRDLGASVQSSLLGEYQLEALRNTEGLGSFVRKLKLILERELDPMGIVVQGYFVKELRDHVGYLNALDANKIADVVKQSRISTAEKALNSALTEAEFKEHAFERSLEAEKNDFERHRFPELQKLRSAIIEEIRRANVEYGEKLRDVLEENVSLELSMNAKVAALEKEVPEDLDNYIEKREVELEREVRTPARKAKEEMEESTRVEAERILHEARKEARHIVLESERKAQRISRDTEKSLERIKRVAGELKGYPLHDFIEALESSVDSDGILQPFIALITNLLKDFESRRQLKTIIKDVPKPMEEEEESHPLMSFEEMNKIPTLCMN